MIPNSKYLIIFLMKGKVIPAINWKKEKPIISDVMNLVQKLFFRQKYLQILSQSNQ